MACNILVVEVSTAIRRIVKRTLDLSQARIKQRMDFGPNGYVSRPFSLTLLCGEINRLLGGTPDESF